MGATRQKFSEAIANIKWKAERRLRAICTRDPSSLAEGLKEALRLINARTNRSDWPKVSLKIDFNDVMYEGHPAAYFLSGYSALSCIRKALDAAGKKSVLSILDFGSGHGRVLRALAANFSEAELTAVDSNKRGVDFCAREFGAKPVYSNFALSNLTFDREFDLIWVGSVFTHLSCERWPKLLTLLRSVLTKNGSLVFSTHALEAERRLRDPHALLLFNLESERIAKILEEHQSEGFGYSDYRRYPGYGVSLSSSEWVTRQLRSVGLEPILNQETGWDDFQDVWAAEKRSN
jgi:2-polyprenyl-3-methyl-5-hydroxy-6-metoxy-1,4-benzoquinol methylase